MTDRVPMLASKLLIRGVSLVLILWGLYRHGLTPEWVMRSVQGYEVNMHSWFWRPPDLPDWVPVGVRWWRSLFIGGAFVLTGIQGWRLSSTISSGPRHPNKTQQPTGAPSGARGSASKTLAGSIMVDRESRDACAQLLRELMRGEMEGEAFEFAVDELGSSDPGIRAIKTQAWACYSDYSPVDRSFARAIRPEIARSILFLQSDAPYCWPPYPSGDFPTYNWLFNVCTLGWWEHRKAERLREWQEHGEHDLWPFHSRADYDAACARPRFLVGSS